MECPHVKTCCCLFSLKTGTLLIVILNLAYSFFGFIAWVSTGILIFVVAKNDDSEHDMKRLVLLHIGVGTVLSLTQLAMGVLLYQGLRTEEPKYVRWYLILGTTVLVMNIASSCMTGIFFTKVALVYPLLIAIPVQAYFLLVIRSGYKEMIQDRMDSRILPNRSEVENAYTPDYVNRAESNMLK